MDKIKIVFVATLILLPTSSYCQSNHQNLTRELLKEYKNSNLTGFAVSIVNTDSIRYKEAFGYENIATEKKYSLSQRFNIASISKTFIGIGLMKLVEEGKLELSTPINLILPFPVVNPYHKNQEIIVEHLARHTSSILFGELGAKTWYLDSEFLLEKKQIGKTAYNDFRCWEKNTKIELGDFLRESLSLDGKFYSKKNFSRKKPGDSYAYSNLGAALAAYIIELKTGIKFIEYLENLVTRELNFKSGIWRHISNNELPTSYFQTKVETPIHRPILYPTGGMILSCNELTQYLIEMIKGYNGNSQILSLESFTTMMSNPDNGRSGIFWELNDNKVGHNGGNYGTTCFMSFDKETRIGKIFMTNISSYNNEDLLKEMIAIWKKLGEYENKL